MERLTERDEYGNADIIALSDMMPELYAELSFIETNALTDALNRLAAYEDTGLEPEEIKDFLKRWKRSVEIADLCEKGGIGHLLELKKAEQAGRLVVLPCRFLQKVNVLPTIENGLTEITAMKCIGFSLSHDSYNANLITDKNKLYQPYFGKFGKTAFLTREEAEAALEAGSAEKL